LEAVATQIGGSTQGLEIVVIADGFCG